MRSDPDACRRDGDLLHQRMEFGAANRAYDDAVEGYLRAGRLGDAVVLAQELITRYADQRDYKASYQQERRAWKLDEGVRALDAAAAADDFGDTELVQIELQRAHVLFTESGYEEATRITATALGHDVIDLTVDVPPRNAGQSSVVQDR